MPNSIGEIMRKIGLLISVLILSGFVGCLSEVDESHPFAGEWTTIGGHKMVFLEGDAVCSSEWIINENSTVSNIIDCMEFSDMKTTTIYNYTFIDSVLFMQTIYLELEYSDPDTNTTSSETSDLMICAAYVPRDMAADESTWIAEVNAVSWPNFCAQILGIEN